ncbi:MAG: hypothetical protein ACLPKI_00090 [Streptosporangiaceae bacterium]
MLRSLLVGRDPADVGAGPLDVPPVLAALRVVVLVVVLITVPLARPHLGAGGPGIALAVCLGVCILSWFGWLFARGRAHLLVVA